MNATFDTVIFYPMSYSNVNVYLQSSSIIATGYFLGKSFSIQADYTQLKNYNYLLCDVSASTIIPVDVSIPTSNINLIPVSSFNYISDLYDTQVNQFYIINQPTNHDLITSITFNISSLSIFSNTHYVSITVYSNTSITLYSASSITFYSSSTSFTSITLYSYSSSTIYSYSSITSYTSTTVYAYSSSTVYNSRIVYSSTTVYSYTAIPPIILSYTGNVTSWSTTYSLSYNQLMILSFTNSQTIFIPLQLTGKDNYDVIISQNITSYNSGGGNNAFLLYPNNISTTIRFADIWLQYNGGWVGVFSGATKLHAFQLTWFLGSIDITIINNSPFTKTIIFRDVELGYSVDPDTHLNAQIWDDYTTSWTMLGTIVLPQTSSGYVKILRIA